ncbi:MAG: hypothetical protein LQ338_007301 [Usnochroma carphineum]|nr:MAG: hypothetical protein LQ338_007301 [Usnochroma carphineum]
MATSEEITAPMTRRQALLHLRRLIDTPEDTLVIGQLVAAHAFDAGRGAGSSGRISSGQTPLGQLEELSGISQERLEDGMTAWTQLYEAAKILGVPDTDSPRSFFRAWQKMGAKLPCYEQYMISAGRAHELITNNELARVMSTKSNDPDSLHRYRKVLRLATPHRSLPCTTPRDIEPEYQDSQLQLETVKEMIRDLNRQFAGDDRGEVSLPERVEFPHGSDVLAGGDKLLEHRDNQGATAANAHEAGRHISPDDRQVDEPQNGHIALRQQLWFLAILILVCWLERWAP